MRNTVLMLLVVAASPMVAGTDSGPVLRLGLKRAVEIALAPDGNARVALASEYVRQAGARSHQARAALLPDFSFAVGEQSQTRNLDATGIHLNIPFPGFSLPRFMGPFNVFDARGSVNWSVFDLSSIRRYQASRVAMKQAASEDEATRNQVTDQVARAYLAAQRAEAHMETAKANVTLAEALVKLASNQKSAGTGTGIEVTRARVQLANERQRLLVAENDRERAHLQLLRAIGLNLSVTLELSDQLARHPVQPTPLAEALKTAMESRPEWSAQHHREEGSRLSYSAAKFERLPTVGSFADYGASGTGIDYALPTRTYGVQMRVSLFDGGRRDGRRAESLSQLRQERVRTKDLKDQIELEVRLALDSLRSADDQVQTAEEGLSLAESELAQAQRRYEAGVTTSLEVTDAQTRLERARENRINALFSYNLARLDLHAAMGVTRRLLQ